MGVCDEESAACKKDVKDYNDAAFERGTAEQTINRASSDVTQAMGVIAAGGTTALAGGVIVGGTGLTGIGAFVGGVAIGFGGGTAAFGYFLLIRATSRRDTARTACDNARLRMKAAYDRTLTSCKLSECRPSPAIAACP